MEPLLPLGRNNSQPHQSQFQSPPLTEKKGKRGSGLKRKVKEIAEKLKTLSVEERLELESVQSLLSALELESLPPQSGLLASLNYCTALLWSASRKYLSLHLSRKISKSNLYCLFFSFLALIFYFELHTSSGFTRLWLKWDDVDLRSVEVRPESTRNSLHFLHHFPPLQFPFLLFPSLCASL